MEQFEFSAKRAMNEQANQDSNMLGALQEQIELERAKRMDAIAEFGPTKWHRRSYEPVKGLCIKQDIGEGVDENILTKLK